MTAETDISSLAHDADPAAKKAFNANVLAQLRANNGRITAGPLAGQPSIILNTIGAKSGKFRETTLFRLDHGGVWYVTAAFAGSPVDPAWAHNLRAHPKLVAEVAGERYAVTARELSREERDAVWPYLVDKNPRFTDYRAKTTRVIPMFELRRDAVQ